MIEKKIKAVALKLIKIQGKRGVALRGRMYYHPTSIRFFIISPKRIVFEFNISAYETLAQKDHYEYLIQVNYYSQMWLRKLLSINTRRKPLKTIMHEITVIMRLLEESKDCELTRVKSNKFNLLMLRKKFSSVNKLNI